MAVPAIITGSAGLLAEISQYIVSKALRGPAITLHDLKPMGIPLSDQFYICTVHSLKLLAAQKIFVDHHIMRRKQKNTTGIFSVASCASRLLIIIFHTLRHIIVNDKSHIGLVDSHAERVSCHYDRQSVINKIFLVLLSYLTVHSRMISCHRNTV